jgi:hypothetical protein
MSALEEVPLEEVEGEVEEPPKRHVPSTAFTAESAAAATAEREAQRTARKMGFAARVREMVGNDPARLANILFDIAENVSGKEKTTDRITATKELIDRGWGKAPTFMPIEGGDPLEKSDLDQAIRDIADQLVARKAHPRLDAELVKREIEEGVRPDPEKP